MNPQKDFALIAALDLDSVKARLMHQESGEGWSAANADAVEFEYRRFLYLMMKFPDQQVAPLLEVDVFWHYHILDTMKYAVDCEQAFGHFLHHRPHNGDRAPAAMADHHRSGARMQELYDATFGQAYSGKDDVQGATAASAPPAAALAWRTPAARNAWCTPATQQAAWCTPATQKTAWCTPATAKTAWCTPVAAITAWCTPATQSSAGSKPGIAVKPGPLVPAPGDKSSKRAVRVPA